MQGVRQEQQAIKAATVKTRSEADAGMSDSVVTLRDSTFTLGEDETGGPAFFWWNPWTLKREKVASLLWPVHPPEATKMVEELFDSFVLSETLQARGLQKRRGERK